MMWCMMLWDEHIQIHSCAYLEFRSQLTFDPACGRCICMHSLEWFNSNKSVTERTVVSDVMNKKHNLMHIPSNTWIMWIALKQKLITITNDCCQHDKCKCTVWHGSYFLSYICYVYVWSTRWSGMHHWKHAICLWGWSLPRTPHGRSQTAYINYWHITAHADDEEFSWNLSTFLN